MLCYLFIEETVNIPMSYENRNAIKLFRNGKGYKVRRKFAVKFHKSNGL